jgi:hypothetical protein
LKIADDAWPGAEVAETKVKRFLCCRFQRTGKEMGQVLQCWWTICREIKVFTGLIITCFTLYSHLWPIYWLSLVLRLCQVQFMFLKGNHLKMFQV